MFAIAFQGTVWDFPVRPESLEISYPARVTVTPTLQSAYVDHFGPGVGVISVSGTTGYGGGSQSHRPNGQRLLSQLISLYARYLKAAQASSNPEAITMTFVDGIAGKSFIVVPDQSGLRVHQQKASPMLRRYTLTMQVVNDLDQPAAPETGLARGLAARVAALPNIAIGASFAAVGALAQPAVAYQMQSGDSLESVAHDFGVDSQQLGRANGIGLPTRLGQNAVLKVFVDG